ncbi:MULTISPECIES: nitroreductase family protein [Psychrobacter]|uniref:nitroreductase family protein n=1 Tax=Psychrobacter TaxID=497 RepID=UPI001CB6F234|nr:MULTISPECIES: nitroreductase family protein [Psychrobacter]
MTEMNQLQNDQERLQQDSLEDNTQENRPNAQVTAEQLINWINSRRSVSNLTIPAPNHDEIRMAIGCAATAPDHKQLKPWRFIVTEGNARHAFGRALLAAAEGIAARDGDTLSEKEQKKTANMPLRAPVIITVVTKMEAHKKVPPFEQLLSAGAAVQNLILALKAQGFSTIWRTGLLCNDPAVKDYFNVGAEDYVTGFIYTGTSPCDKSARKPADIEPLTRFEA